MRIAAITTVDHNVGDDFVREGILHLVTQVVPCRHVLLVHKHLPITARPEWEWMYKSGACRLLDRLPRLSGLGVTSRLDARLDLNPKTDRILNCDLLVQCGAPVYWLHGASSCARNEWYEPLIRRRWNAVRDQVPFLSLAGGSCQAYHSDGSEFEAAPETLAYLREFFDACQLTTLRDPLAARILEMAGRKAPVLPCASIFARMRLGLVPLPAKRIALNYMPMGGHYAFSPSFKPEVWERTFVEFVRGLTDVRDYVFVCHNRREYDAARRLFPAFEVFFSTDYREYLRFFSSIRYGIFNRVHAAFALASFGRPSFVVGSDSRARMCSNLGLRHCFITEATPERLSTELAELEQMWQQFSGQMQLVQTKAEAAYLDLLKPILQ
jgi:hypothetical protein